MHKLGESTSYAIVVFGQTIWFYSANKLTSVLSDVRALGSIVANVLFRYQISRETRRQSFISGVRNLTFNLKIYLMGDVCKLWHQLISIFIPITSDIKY